MMKTWFSFGTNKSLSFPTPTMKKISKAQIGKIQMLLFIPFCVPKVNKQKNWVVLKLVTFYINCYEHLKLQEINKSKHGNFSWKLDMVW
jgi:hypothetical protein